MAGVAIVLSFLKSIITVDFLGQFAAEKAFDNVIDNIRGAIKKNEPITVEEELLICLNIALKDVCNKYRLEYDANAIGETFMLSWQTAGSLARLNTLDTEKAFKKILTEALGMPVDESILEFWSQCIIENISSFPHLNNYFVQNKLDVIADNTNQIKEASQLVLHKTVEIPDMSKRTAMKINDDINTEYDFHIELIKRFNELFPKSKGSDVPLAVTQKKMPSFNEIDEFANWLHSLSAVEQWNFKYARELLYFQTNGEHKDFWEIYNEEDATSVTRRPVSNNSGKIKNGISAREIIIPNHDGHVANYQEECHGKYFSLYEPRATYTLIYQIDRVALPEKHKLIYFPTRLDMAGEFLDDDWDCTRRTFFIDKPSQNGNHLAIFTFNNNPEQSIIVVNTGFLESDSVKFSKRPTVLRMRNTTSNVKFMTSTDIDLPGFIINNTNVEVKKIKYTFDIENTIIIIDTETGEEIKPVFNNKSEEGFIEIKPYKKYYAFQIRPMDGKDIELDDYEIGCAFKYGKYRLRVDYKKAVYYLELAETIGNMYAKAELVEMYEKGIGCAVNKSKANRLRKEIGEYNNRLLEESV